MAQLGTKKVGNAAEVGGLKSERPRLLRERFGRMRKVTLADEEAYVHVLHRAAPRSRPDLRRVVPQQIRGSRRAVKTSDETGWRVECVCEHWLWAFERAPETLRCIGDVPSRIVPRGEDDVALEVLTVHRFRYEVARSADWFQNTQNGQTPAMPPLDVVRDLLAHPAPPLPELRRITRAPVFVPGPRLLNVPGYDTRSQTYYAQPDCLAALEVPSRPSRDAIGSARRFLLEELLGDFPSLRILIGRTPCA